MNEETKGLLSVFILGFFLGAAILAFIIVCIDPVMLKQETIDDICKELTSNENVVAEEEEGKLICLIPGFDETHNIIIRGNDG